MDRNEDPSRRPGGTPSGAGDKTPTAAGRAPPRPAPEPGRPLRLLVLGGTGFLGRHFTAAALAAGHRVTLFNRGRTGAELFPEAEHLRGDRTESLAALRGRRWDAAIDTSGQLPAVVRASAELLADRVGLYLFVSSVSAYADFSSPGVEEGARLATLPEDASPDELSDEAYGALKALCEGEVRLAMGDDRALIVRPGLIVGPYDTSDRFGYWVRRVSQGGRILAPGPPERPVQFIDARDLAAWMLRMVEGRMGGVFNATGPDRPLALEWLLETCRVESGRGAEFVWASEDFLLGNGVQPWTELPLWVPEAAGTHAHFLEVSNRRAVEAGLTFRRILDTVHDVRRFEEARERDADEEIGTLTAEREEELLEAWAAGR